MPAFQFTARGKSCRATSAGKKAALAAHRNVSRRAADEQAKINPDHRRVAPGDEGQAETRRRDDRRRQHDDALAVVIVRDMPGGQREQKHRDHLHQPHEAERQRRTGALVNFPADGDGEHLLAERRHEPANEIKREVPVPENGIRIVAGDARRRRAQIFW